MTTRTRIAHLSDIHFGTGFDAALWASVKQAVAEAQPDLVIVSGDFVQSPFPLMLILARRELDDFCQTLGKPWFVVPGNHDVAFFGNLRIWPFTRFFGGIFSQRLGAGSWLKGYPSFSNFYDKHSRLARLVLRAMFYCKFVLCFHWARMSWALSTVPRRHTLTAPVPVELFGLDSNRSSFLAAGKVHRVELTGLGRQLREMTVRALSNQAMFHRVVVLHHHAVPVPYAPESMTSFEPFLVLREAGTLLNELWSHDVDLVLHGHRHLPNFSRIAFGSVESNPRTIPVLAAASPTVRGPKGGNSFNLIDLYANGRLSVTPIFFGGGVTIKGTVDPDSKTFDALSLEELKVRSFQRSKRLASLVCKEIRRNIVIGDHGDTRATMRVEGLGVVGDQMINEQVHEFTVDLGKLDPSRFALVDATQSVVIQSRTPEKELSRKVIVKIGMPALGRGVLVSYGLEYFVANHFRLSAWECKHIHVAHCETAGVRVRFPARRLRFGVELPTLLSNPRPTLRCYRPAHYPQLEIDPVTNDVLAPADDQWSLDADITEHEKDNLVEVRPNFWEMSVAFPLLGYKYAIEWSVRDIRETCINARYVGETEAVRRAAAGYRSRRKKAIATGALLPGDPLSRVLSLLLDEFRSRFGAQDLGSEILRACLFSFDSQTLGAESSSADIGKPIVAIEEAVLGTTEGPNDLGDWTMEYGGGVAGLSFKTAYPQIYFEPAIRLGRPASGAYFALANRLSLEAVIALPVYHPKAWEAVMDGRGEFADEIEFAELPSSHEVMGVLTFASDSPGSRVGALYDENMSKREKTALVFEFLDVVQKTAKSIIRSLMESQLTLE